MSNPIGLYPARLSGDIMNQISVLSRFSREHDCEWVDVDGILAAETAANLQWNHCNLAQWDLDHVWHPFTQAKEWEAEGEPLIIERAMGCTLIDVHGREYLDGISSLWTNVHGHQHPAINQALREQMDRVAHSTMLGQAGVPSIVLAKRLADLLLRIEGEEPPLTRTFYSDF